MNSKIINLIYSLKIGIIVDRFIRISYLCKIKKFEKFSKCKINVVFQGPGGIEIGHPENFKIDGTSALKSNTFIL